MKRLLLRLLAYPPIGKFFLNKMKKGILKPFEAPLSESMERQEGMLKEKFKRIERTEIGRKLGIREGTKLHDISLTDYEFYEPFYDNPSPSAFMYPLKSYERIKSSGTAGSEKWFMVPRTYIIKSAFETGIPYALLCTHDGEKITLEYGDTFYVNTAPRPFAVGVMASVISGKGRKFPLLNLVPNFNLPFEEKVRYFMNNCDRIDFAFVQASILVSQIMPAVKTPIKMKGLFCPDTAIAETYFDEISRFAGVPPRTAYNSTETLNCSIISLQYPLGFFFDWRRGVFEFVPVGNGDVRESEIIGIDEVEPGKVYNLVYTGFETELTRYNTWNAFKCVGKGDDILGIDYPIFKFHARLEKTISLHNFTRISEDEIIAAFRENNIQFTEFTAREETEKGLEYLVIYVETTGDMSGEEIQELLNKQLYDKDKDYRDLVDFYDYVPVKIRLIPKGIFAEYLMHKIAAISKVDRIKMRDDEFEKLLYLIKRN